MIVSFVIFAIISNAKVIKKCSNLIHILHSSSMFRLSDYKTSGGCVHIKYIK